MAIGIRSYRNAVLSASILILTLMLGGCFTLSVNPLHTPQDIVSDPGLLGIWGIPDDPDSETWQFMDLGNGRMRLVIRQDNTLRVQPEQDGILEAHLLKLGEATYLDLFPEEPENGNEIFLGHVVPAHSFWKIQREGGTLTLYALDNTTLEEGIKNGTIVIDHVKRDDVLVLTAPIADLQAMVRQHSDQLFPDGEPMQRVQ